MAGAPLAYRHQKVQRLRRLLRRRPLRDSEGVFVIEGEKLLQEAVSAGASVESVFVAAGHESALVSAQLEAGVRVFDLENGVMERVADTVTPQPVCAVVRAVHRRVEDLETAASVVVLVDVRDPGNAGTILRSAEASGVGGVIFCEGSVDVYNPKTVRSSTGSLFHVPIAVGADAADTLRTLGHFGFVCAGTAMEASTDYDRADLTRKMAFVFGNEANGLSADILGAVHETLSIPILGRSESLNVSMAASVLCFEAARQRRVA